LLRTRSRRTVLPGLKKFLGWVITYSGVHPVFYGGIGFSPPPEFRGLLLHLACERPGRHQSLGAARGAEPEKGSYRNHAARFGGNQDGVFEPFEPDTRPGYDRQAVNGVLLPNRLVLRSPRLISSAGVQGPRRGAGGREGAGASRPRRVRPGIRRRSRRCGGWSSRSQLIQPRGHQ